MRRFNVVASVFLSLMLTTLASGQATSTLSGTVEDVDGALIPSADIFALNQDTGVEANVLTNSSGTYNFLAMQPGEYTVRAEFPGFETQRVTGVTLRANSAQRLDFTLPVAGQATAIDVVIDGDQLLLESSPSVGDVLEAEEVVNLPTVTNNVLDLINVMAGVTRNTEGFNLGINADFAGVSSNNINVMRDGIAVNDQRWAAAGVNSATVINPNMVGEMRMILAPVDAETGRGNGQVQITTRSGGNQFRGQAEWNVRNSALDARTFNDNSVQGGPPTQPWENQNQYTISYGGPIIRNKTFFFVLWDQNISKSRQTALTQVLSPCMQQGVYRYWDFWDPSAADDSLTDSGASPSRPSVDFSGNPLAPTSNPTSMGGGAYTGQLRHVSLFGQVTNAPGAIANDCSNVNVAAAPTGSGTWDANRNGIDPFFTFLNSRAPEVNTYEESDQGIALDGLNVVGHRWNRTVDGRDNLFGVGEPNPRKQINVKIDHNFNQAHRLASSYSYETVNADDTYEGWVDSYEGRLLRKPQVLSFNLTSTLAANIVNEARFGMTRQGTNVIHATDLPDGRGEELLDLLPTTNGMPLLMQWCTPAGFLQPATMSWCGQNGGLVGARGNGPSASTTIDTSPRWTISDTLSWTLGRHSYKLGATYIRATSKTEVSGGNINDNGFPVAFLGATSLAPNTAFSPGGSFRANNPALSTGLTTATADRIEDLLLFLSGSMDFVDQGRFINSPDQAGTSWNDAIGGELFAVRDLHQNEFNSFFKDDWKVTDDLTLNLGMRWDYYGVPYDKNGMTMTVTGFDEGAFGLSGTGFDDWLPSNPAEVGSLTQFVFVGPNSPNPDMSVYERDLNNFGPAIGFSYNIPWLGRDRTVLRGGYQASFLGGGGASDISGWIQDPPGSQTAAVFDGVNGGEYFDFNDVVNGLGTPVEPLFLPVLPVPSGDRSDSITVFDHEYKTPYIQNLTASITHTINSTFSVDVRYIGTLSRKLAESFNLNVPNLYQNGLFQAFEAARAGGESALLDQIFDGIDMRTGGPTPRIVGQNGLTGAGLLRTDTRWANNLADGDFHAIAGNFANLNYSPTFNPGLPNPGALGGSVLRVNGFPDNFIITNPQFNNSSVRVNMGHRNYHSMQSQLTMRPAHGLSTTVSYTWAKNLGRCSGGNTCSGYSVPWERARDYRLTANGRAHSFRAYGTFNLPFGPNQTFLGNSSGVLARVVEGWEMSWIYNLSSGVPLNLTSSNRTYSGGEPILVGEFDPEIGVQWEDGSDSGWYFGEGQYVIDLDPQCTNPAIVAPSLQGQCDRNALYDTAGNLIFRTPLPGETGTYRDHLFGPATWTLDMAVTKRVQLNERMNVEVRMDATNIFNHPTPGTQAGFSTNTLPNGTSIQNGNFGEYTGKFGSRIFQLKARLEF